MRNKHNYVNKELKKVSKEELLTALREVNQKNEEHRRAMQQGVNEALRSGFYCTGGRTNIKPLF